MRRSLVQTLILLAAISAAGCSRPAADPVRPGKTTFRELKALRGEPTRVVSSSIRPRAKLAQYASGESFQIEKGKVVGHFRPPSEQEKEGQIQVWFQRWKNITTVRHAVKTDGHSPRLEQLDAPSLGTLVVFETETGNVVRVTRYGTPESR